MRSTCWKAQDVQHARSWERDGLGDQYLVEFITNVKINYKTRNWGCTYVLQNVI